MDLGNYPSNQKMYDTTNKKVLGQSKSEETFEITDLCGLKPTCNAYKVYTGEEFEEHKKAKGVLRNKKTICTLKNMPGHWMKTQKETTTFNAIRSKYHQVYSISQTKIALTSFCKKRCWTDDCFKFSSLWAIDILSLKPQW